MQTLYHYFLIAAILISVVGTINAEVLSISSGTSFGMCFGYCRQSINMTSNPLKIEASKEPNFAHQTYPPVHTTLSFPSNQWSELISLLNLKIFTALSNTIGCPDCADGGAEWIQVNWTDGNKRVTFQYGRDVNGIEGLIKKLRQIRQDYLTNI